MTDVVGYGRTGFAWPLLHKSSVLKKTAVILQILELKDDLPSFSEWDMLRKCVSRNLIW